MERMEMCFKKEGLVKQDKDREVTLEFDIISHCYKIIALLLIAIIAIRLLVIAIRAVLVER